MYLVVALAIGVLGGTGCGDDDGVHNTVAFEKLAFASQMGVDQFQHALGQIVLFQQMAKVQVVGLAQTFPRARRETKKLPLFPSIIVKPKTTTAAVSSAVHELG